MWIDPEFTFNPHIDHVMKKVHFGVGILYHSRVIVLHLMLERDLFHNLYCQDHGQIMVPPFFLPSTEGKKKF